MVVAEGGADRVGQVPILAQDGQMAGGSIRSDRIAEMLLGSGNSEPN